MTWLRHTENLDVFLDSGLPAGQRFYLASKLLALLALACLMLQVIFMLMSRYGGSTVFKWHSRAHMWLGIISFVFITAHSAAFFFAASLRGGAPALALLLPNFHSGLYNAAVSLGVIALYLSVFLIVFGFLSRPRQSKFKRIHHIIVWMVLLCVVVHSIAIGSESKTWPMLIVYVVSIGLVGWLLLKKSHKT